MKAPRQSLTFTKEPSPKCSVHPTATYCKISFQFKRYVNELLKCSRPMFPKWYTQLLESSSSFPVPHCMSRALYPHRWQVSLLLWNSVLMSIYGQKEYRMDADSNSMRPNISLISRNTLYIGERKEGWKISGRMEEKKHKMERHRKERGKRKGRRRYKRMN